MINYIYFQSYFMFFYKWFLKQNMQIRKKFCFSGYSKSCPQWEETVVLVIQFYDKSEQTDRAAFYI